MIKVLERDTKSFKEYAFELLEKKNEKGNVVMIDVYVYTIKSREGINSIAGYYKNFSNIVHCIRATCNFQLNI